RRMRSEGIVRIAGGGAQLTLWLESCNDWASLTVTGQHFNSPLSLIQTLLTLARKLHALLEQFKTLLQRQFALLQLADDALKFFQRRFESLCFCVAHFG